MESVVKYSVYAVIIIVIVVGSIALSAWIIMLLWGALAHAFDFSTISFKVAVLVSLALSLVGSFFKSSKN